MNKDILLLSLLLALSPASGLTREQNATSTIAGNKIENDDDFLNMVEKSAFWYFWNETGDNGLIQDRMTDKNISTTMGGGFQLTALCIGAERGWITREQAARKVYQILETYKNFVPRFHGMMAHFYDIKTGKPVPLLHAEDDGADVSETGYLMAGIITCRQYFNRSNSIEKQIRKLATELYEQVEWDWMLQDSQGKIQKTLSWHWSPNYGFKIGQRVLGNMEISSMITYILAMGSPAHPIPSECWDEGWARYYRWGTYSGKTFITCPPMFAHQYSHLWIDFRNRRDHHTDYFRNSIYATRENRRYCLEKLYPGKDVWGLTFCDGPFDYGVYGYPPKAGNVDRDATIAPTAPAASIVFTPAESISTLRYMYQNYKDKLWGKYGFKDSFSLKHNWFDDDYLALDQGAMLMMIENYRTGFIWKYFMKDPDVKKGLDRAGFVGLIDNFEKTEDPYITPYAMWSAKPEGQVRFELVSRPFREGDFSFKITHDLTTSRHFTLTATPSLSNLSDYAYLAFWMKSGCAPSTVELTDKSGRKADCRLLKKFNNSGWTLYYYKLPQKISLNAVKNLIFNFEPQKNKGMFLFDFIHTTNILPDDSTPSPAIYFHAESGKYPGEINLTWKQPEVSSPHGKMVRYCLVYSTQPFTSAENIVLAGLEQRVPFFKIKGSDDGIRWSYMAKGLKPETKYYFGLITADVFNRFSMPVVTSSISRGGKVKLLSSGIIDNFSVINGWNKVKTEKSKLQVTSIDGCQGKAVRLRYRLPANSSWVVFEKDITLILPMDFQFRFDVRGKTGRKNTLEFKVVDRQGSTFWKKWTTDELPTGWESITVSRDDLDYAWGPSQEMDTIIERIGFAVSSVDGGAGTLDIDELILKQK